MRYQHGTPAGYNAGGCRCDQCRAGVAAYARRRTRLRAYGRWDGELTNGDGARQALAELNASGLSVKLVAVLTGLSYSNLRDLRDGSPCLLRTELKLREAVGPHDPYSRPSLATIRRLRALYAVGWTPTIIAETSGIKHQTINDLARGRDTVLSTTETAIEAAFRKLIVKTAPDTMWSRKVRRRAQTSGWAPPGAWDNIDDPHEHPQGTPGRDDNRWEHLHHDVEELAHQGHTRTQIAERLGRKWASIQDTYRRNNTPLPHQLRSTG